MNLPTDVLPLLRELGDLKRIRSAARDGTIATRLFESGWAAWLSGESRDDIAYRAMAAAVVAARMGDLDYDKLGELGLSDAKRRSAMTAAMDEIAASLDRDLIETMKAQIANPLPPAGDLPHALTLLRDQPRAGVTGPGRPRIMLQPEENHAEHSFVVALYAGLLAPFYDADPSQAFWHGMIHHLHSAAMPDAGFTGEVLLGDALDRVIETARGIALADLPDPIAAECRT
ncbi:MAG: hypothetical protein WA948_08135, partial [Pontixanthobacter sp.]